MGNENDRPATDAEKAELGWSDLDRTDGGQHDQLKQDPRMRMLMLARARQRRDQLKAQQGAATVAKKNQAANAVDHPEAAEVDGVPTGSTVHYDDDNAVEITTNEKPGAKYGYKDGKVTRDTTDTTTTTLGDEKKVDQKKTTVAAGAKGAGVEHGVSHSVTEGEVSHKTEVSGGVDVDYAEGAKLKGHHEVEAGVGENKQKKATDASAGVDWKGNVSGEVGRTNAKETEKGSSDTTKKVGFSTEGGGQIKGGVGKKTVVNQMGPDNKPVMGEDNKPVVASSKSSDVSGHVGREGAGVDASHSSTNQAGTTHAVSAGADVNWKEGSATVHAGYSMMTKGGSSVKVTAHAGRTVNAQDPVKVGDHWEVTYMVTKSVGAGGGASKGPVGGSVSAEHSNFHSGVREFKDLEKAKDFKEHAAEKIDDPADPTSAKGAMAIPIGETRGMGSTDAVGASGQVNIEFASVGASHTKTKTNEVDVHRVSEHLFDVTVMVASGKGTDVTADAKFLSDSKGGSSNSYKAVTARFDLSTKEGQAAFQKFCSDRIPPTSGGKLMRTEEGEGEETHDKVAVAGLGTAQWKGETSEKHVQDDKGKHDQFEGKKSHDQDPSWIAKHVFGDDEEHSSMQIDSKLENGKEAGYTLTGHLSGGDGAYNRKTMGQMFSDGKHDGAKASGDWTLTADVDMATLRELEKVSPELRAAKTREDKMRVLSKLMADNGTRMASGLQHSELGWDLELKGDPNFPGHAGRVALESLVKQLNAAIASNPAAGNEIVHQCQGQIMQLEARRAAVADKKRYTDIPDELREEQLKVIDHHMDQFEHTRHFALLEATKNKPGENLKQIKTREADTHGYDKMPAEQREQAKLRDKISDNDNELSGFTSLVNMAYGALSKVSPERRDAGLKQGSSAKMGPALAAFHQGWNEAKGFIAAVMALNQPIDDLRLKLVTGVNSQATATELARSITVMQNQKLELTRALYNKLREAAEKRKPITSAAAINADKEFWSSIPGDDGDDNA